MRSGGRLLRHAVATLLMQMTMLGPAAAAPDLRSPAPLVPPAPPVPPLRLADTMAERIQPCTQCHGKEGRATRVGYFPRIAGKPAGYLYQQLLNFRDGRRRNETMAHLVEHLSDAYLKEIASYFASLDLPYPAATPAGPNDDTAHGDALVHLGDAARGIPACVACHGAALTGVAPAIPGLLGLPRDYLAAQFGAWRAGQRRAAAPDCMAAITAKLSPDDVGALAAWLASQAVPGHALPAAPGSLPASLPIACGSVRP